MHIIREKKSIWETTFPFLLNKIFKALVNNLDIFQFLSSSRKFHCPLSPSYYFFHTSKLLFINLLQTNLSLECIPNARNKTKNILKKKLDKMKTKSIYITSRVCLAIHPSRAQRRNGGRALAMSIALDRVEGMFLWFFWSLETKRYSPTYINWW